MVSETGNLVAVVIVLVGVGGAVAVGHRGDRAVAVVGVGGWCLPAEDKAGGVRALSRSDVPLGLTAFGAATVNA